MRRVFAGFLISSLLLAAVSCGPEEDVERRSPRRFAFLANLESRIAKLRGEDGTWFRDYLAGGGAHNEEVNERKMSTILGEMLHEDPPESLARFVRHAERHLYQEFFYAFTETERLALAETIREQFDDGSILGEKYAAVLTARGGKFPDTLERVIRSLPLTMLSEPTPLPRDRILAIAHDSNDPGIMAGASGILAENVWVASDGGDTRISLMAANNLMAEALKRVPEDPIIRMSYVLQCFHVPDIPRARLQSICRRGAEAEPENAAYIYLQALTLLEAGSDLEALARIQEGLAKPFVTFHDVGRAETTSAFLRAAGLGVVGSRLASYRAANVDGPMKMRRLAQSLRNLPLAMEGNPAVAVLFPRRLSEQIARKPRLLRTEHIRLELLIGSWEYSLNENPDDPAALAARKEFQALKDGRRLASGPEAWDEFFSRLGEEGFRKYMDDVLFGHEAEFLKRCATEVSVEDCAKLLK